MRNGNILIRVSPRFFDSERRYVPSAPTPAERYLDFQQRYRAQTSEIPFNNYPWKFRKLSEDSKNG